MDDRQSNAIPDRQIEGCHKKQRRYASQALFHDAREILIDHAGHEYRLRITRHDKLILTK